MLHVMQNGQLLLDAIQLHSQSLFCCAGQPKALHSCPQQEEDCLTFCVPGHDQDSLASAESYMGGGPAKDVAVYHQASSL